MIVGFQAIPSPLDFHSILVVQNVPMMSPLCPLYPHDLPIVVGDISPFFHGQIVLKTSIAMLHIHHSSMISLWSKATKPRKVDMNPLNPIKSIIK